MQPLGISAPWWIHDNQWRTRRPQACGCWWYQRGAGLLCAGRRGSLEVQRPARAEWGEPVAANTGWAHPSPGQAAGPLIFRRIIDVPFGAWVAALDGWQRTGHRDLRVGDSLLRGPAARDRQTGTRRIQVRLARGPLRPPLPMRLDIDRWSASATVVELIPCGRARPTAAYFRAGHRLLDLLPGSLLPYQAAAGAPDTARRPPVPVSSGRP